MNSVNLTGRLTKDIEIRKTQSGKSVTSFSLAVRRDRSNTDFISCVAWETTADFLGRYGKKGNKIGIIGKIQTRTYDSNGRTVYVTEVICNYVELLEVKEEKPKEETKAPSFDEYDIEISDEELPF